MDKREILGRVLAISDLAWSGDSPISEVAEQARELAGEIAADINTATVASDAEATAAEVERLKDRLGREAKVNESQARDIRTLMLTLDQIEVTCKAAGIAVDRMGWPEMVQRLAASRDRACVDLAERSCEAGSLKAENERLKTAIPEPNRPRSVFEQMDALGPGCPPANGTPFTPAEKADNFQFRIREFEDRVGAVQKTMAKHSQRVMSTLGELGLSTQNLSKLGDVLMQMMERSDARIDGLELRVNALDGRDTARDDLAESLALVDGD